MKNERQLELNFDDPVEWLAPPTYLVNAIRRSDPRLSGAAAVEIRIHITVKAEVVAAKIPGEEGA